MIAAQDVKKLRDVTGAGMMDCKKALTEANGDFDAAIDILRKKGQKVSAKRAEREATEGIVAVKVDPSGTFGVLVEVNCETDFVARNEEFVSFADEVAGRALEERPAALEDLLQVKLSSGRTVAEMSVDLMGKIGEKIGVSAYKSMEATDGRLVSYVHPGSKLGVLVAARGTGDVEVVGRDVAMQVAALNPVARSRDEVPESVREKEVEIGREMARNEGKPDNIVDRIAQGKLERFYKDHVLLEQPFVKEASSTVSEMLSKAGVEVTAYERFVLGN